MFLYFNHKNLICWKKQLTQEDQAINCWGMRTKLMSRGWGKLTTLSHLQENKRFSLSLTDHVIDTHDYRVCRNLILKRLKVYPYSFTSEVSKFETFLTLTWHLIRSLEFEMKITLYNVFFLVRKLQWGEIDPLPRINFHIKLSIML